MPNPGMLQTPKLEILVNGSDSSADSYDDDGEADKETMSEVSISIGRSDRGREGGGGGSQAVCWVAVQWAHLGGIT